MNNMELMLLLAGLALHGLATLGGMFAFFYRFAVKIEHRFTVLETELGFRTVKEHKHVHPDQSRWPN